MMDGETIKATRIYPDKEEADGEDYGPCCACSLVRRGVVRNVVTLNKPAPIPGTGWGCVICGLPMDGALAVLCDGCIRSNAAPMFAVYGYLQDGRRIRIMDLSGEWDHRMEFHPEARERGQG